MKTMNRQHYQRRKRTRGAAMIEAVIVLSTLLVFLGLIVWTRNSYGMKLDMQQSTRSSSLYYASHGCTGDKGGSTSEASGTVPDSSPEAENVAKKSAISGSAVASRVYNTASAKLAGKSTWAAVWDSNAGSGRAMEPKKQGLSRPVEGSSKVTCNEPEYDGGFNDFIDFATRFVGGGMNTVGGLFK